MSSEEKNPRKISSQTKITNILLSTCNNVNSSKSNITFMTSSDTDWLIDIYKVNVITNISDALYQHTENDSVKAAK